MDKRYQVFVSSTFADLMEERSKVIQTIMELDCIPAGMEIFPAIDDEQFEFIKRVIDDCDYYILIVGGRYGSVSNDGLSYTEKEYDYAVERGLKVMAFIHANPDSIPVGKSEKDIKLKEKLESFKHKVTNNRLVKFWNNADELPGLVALSLAKTIKTYPAIGWVRGDGAITPELYQELEKLRKENIKLKESSNQASEKKIAIEESLQKRISRILKLWSVREGGEHYSSFYVEDKKYGDNKEYYIYKPEGNFSYYFFNKNNEKEYCLIISIIDTFALIQKNLADIRVMISKYEKIPNLPFRFIIAVGIDKLEQEKITALDFFDNALSIAKVKPKKRFSLELWDKFDVESIEKELGIRL